MTAEADHAPTDAQRLDRLEASVRVIATGHAQLAEQMAELVVSQVRTDQKNAEHSKRLDKIDADLAENSALTRETWQNAKDIRDVVITAKTGGKLVRWATPTLVAIGLTVATVKGWGEHLAAWLKS
jgi:septal ring factor EnvC (AmiA/AmiB activator)